MIRLLNKLKAEELLSNSKGNLKRIDLDRVMDAVRMDIYSRLPDLGIGSIYVFYQGPYSYWFELDDIVRRVVAGGYRFCKDYNIKLTHICQKDEALLVL